MWLKGTLSASPPFSMLSKSLILHGEAKFNYVTVCCVPEALVVSQ